MCIKGYESHGETTPQWLTPRGYTKCLREVLAVNNLEIVEPGSCQRMEWRVVVQTTLKFAKFTGLRKWMK
jgi:hypothetical protein